MIFKKQFKMLVTSLDPWLQTLLSKMEWQSNLIICLQRLCIAFYTVPTLDLYNGHGHSHRQYISKTDYLTTSPALHHMTHKPESVNLKKLRLFGYPMIIRLPGKRPAKLDTHATTGIFLHSLQQNTAYIIRTP